MSEDQFTKLFEYMQKRFDEVDDRFITLEDRFDKMLTVLADKVGVDLDKIHA